LGILLKGEDTMIDIESLVTDFLAVCALARLKLTKDEITPQRLSAGAEHRGIGSLPEGKTAVYIFLDQSAPSPDRCLKAGRVSENSNARFRYQHYSPHSSQSNLAASLLNDPSAPAELTDANVGDWIKDNTARINLLLPAAKGAAVLNLLEAFVHARLNPKYEG
jgi:hypothetical protein